MRRNIWRRSGDKNELLGLSFPSNLWHSRQPSNVASTTASHAARAPTSASDAAGATSACASTSTSTGDAARAASTGRSTRAPAGAAA